uniref:Major sperm protein n=1 Tax=Caenorhabditis japonica TaxID=281687 RepID=A0A8R1I8L3_CAEJA
MEKSEDGVKTVPLQQTVSDSQLSERADVDLSVDPEEALFPPVGAGKSDHMVVNYTKFRLALKAKCSNNGVFRVDPVFQIIEPNKCKNVTISRSPGGVIKKNDKVLLMYAPCDEKMTDVKAFFKELDLKSKDGQKYVKIPIGVESGQKKVNLDR